MPVNTAFVGAYGSGANFASVYDSIARKPQAYAELLQKYGEGLKVLNFLNMAGKTVPLTTNSLKIIEEGAKEMLVTVSISTNNANTEASLTFKADGSSTYVREGWDILIPKANTGLAYDKPMRIYKSGSDWKGRFWDTTTHITTALVEVQVALGAPAYGYGTGQPSPMFNGYFYRTTGNRILKDTTGLEGSQLYKEDFYAVEMANGAKGILTKSTIEADFRLDASIDAALLTSEVNANTSNITAVSDITGATNAVPSFDGLIPTMRKLGLALPWTTAFDATKFQAIKALLESVGVLNREVDFMVGTDLNAQIEVDMLSWLSTYARTPGLYTNMADVGFNVKKVTLNSVTSNIMELHSFANPVKFGAAAHGYRKMGMIFPQGERKVVVANPGSVKEELRLGHLTLGYPSAKGEDRKRIFTASPGVTNTSPIAVNDKDGSFYYLMAEIIPIWSYMNQTILVEG